MEICDRAIAIGAEAVGLTDHGTVSGHLEFAKVTAAKGLKPIFGCELYHGVKSEFGKNERDQAHFIAGALTDEGLRNLWRMVDAASTNFRYVGRVNWDICRTFREGVFATSACISGLVAQGVLKDELDPYDVLNKYLDCYGENFYIEIHTYPGEEHERLNHELVRIAWERGVPLVYATDAHFASPEQYKAHDAYVAMQTGESVLLDPADRKMWHPKSLYMQDEAQIRASLAYLPERAVDEALTNTAAIADRVNAQLPAVRRHLPTFIPRLCPWNTVGNRDPRNAAEMLLDLVAEGLEWRYPDGNPEAWARAEEEIRVYLDAPGPAAGGGLEHYFLQAWDFIQFCKNKHIERGPGRGSAGGSIVAYALEITDIDPLFYGLYFERFYNPGRAKGFPDIDSDFPKRSRKTVRDYMVQRWAAPYVRSIGTIRRLKPKDAIDKTYKASGALWDEKEALKAIVDRVPDLEILGPDSIGWSQATDPGKLNSDGTVSPKRIYVMDKVGPAILDWLAEQPPERLELLMDWLDLIEVVCSRVSGYGVHPSGVVVSDVPLADELPCMWNSNQKVQVTCFPMDDVDARQFNKQDFLGLRNLDTLEMWRELAGEDAPEWSGLERTVNPDAMWDLLARGYTFGIFQIEDGFGRTLCKRLKPRSVADLAVIVALNRPGPIRSGAVEHFISRHNGEEAVEYDHPLLKAVLEETYGLFLYQEQVIKFCEVIGYSKSDADAVRKMIGKKSPEDMQAFAEGRGEWQGKAYTEMAEAAGIPGDVAKTIIDKIAEFSLYSFNKSHAVAYAVLGWRTAFAKSSRLTEFILASIATMDDDPKKAEKTSGFIGEGRRLGIVTHAPDITLSGVGPAIINGEIYFGLANVKGIGAGTARHICELRENHDLSQREKILGASVEEQRTWKLRQDAALTRGEKFNVRSPQALLPADRVEALWNAGAWDNYETRDIPLRRRQALEKDRLGVILTDDSAEVLSRHTDVLEECDGYGEIEFLKEGDSIILPGVITQVIPKTTRAGGKPMGIVTIEYDGDEAEFVVFSKDWKRHEALWHDRVTGVFTLRRSARGIHFDKGWALA